MSSWREGELWSQIHIEKLHLVDGLERHGVGVDLVCGHHGLRPGDVARGVEDEDDGVIVRVAVAVTSVSASGF